MKWHLTHCLSLQKNGESSWRRGRTMHPLLRWWISHSRCKLLRCWQWLARMVEKSTRHYGNGLMTEMTDVFCLSWDNSRNIANLEKTFLLKDINWIKERRKVATRWRKRSRVHKCYATTISQTKCPSGAMRHNQDLAQHWCRTANRWLITWHPHHITLRATANLRMRWRRWNYSLPNRVVSRSTWRYSTGEIHHPKVRARVLLNDSWVDGVKRCYQPLERCWNHARTPMPIHDHWQAESDISRFTTTNTNVRLRR